MSDHTQLSGRAYIAIGLMLFALFFGAGNLIFPATLGQHAGTNVWWAILGFIVTGVGLPLLGVMAMGYSGSRNVQSLASRVHQYLGSYLHWHYTYPLALPLPFLVRGLYPMKLQ